MESARQTKLSPKRVQSKLAKATEGFRSHQSCANGTLHWTAEMEHLLKGMRLTLHAPQSLLPQLSAPCSNANQHRVVLRFGQPLMDGRNQTKSLFHTGHWAAASARPGLVSALAAQWWRLDYTPLALPRAQQILKHLAQTCQVSFTWRETGSFTSRFKAWGQADPQCCSDRVRGYRKIHQWNARADRH